MNEDRKDIHSAVRELIIEDPTYYDRLITDPREALRQGLGVDIPGSVGIQVHRQSPERLHIVLPFQLPPEAHSAESSDVGDADASFE